MSVLAACLTGHNPEHGFHVIAVFSVRIFMVLVALSIHEWSHGAVAYLFGDYTAYKEGRLSLNPLKHFDTTGLLIVPGVLMAFHFPLIIGWAKPIPVKFENMKNLRLGMALTALAGPFSNFLLAFTISSLMHILRLNGTEGILSSLIWTFVIMNFGLAFFNLLPFYPMDGGRLIVSLLPLKVINWLACRERLFSFVAIFLVVLLPVFLYIIFGKNKMNYFSHEILVFTDLLTSAPHMSWFSHMYKWMRII